MMGMVGGPQALLSSQMQKKVSRKLNAPQIILMELKYIVFKVLDQLNSLLKSEQDGLKMNIEEWGGGTLSLGPCFPNPGTLLAMPCLRDFEVGSPGTSLPNHLLQGLVHFGCSETSNVWPGGVDGAVRAGERAALEVLQQLTPQV